MADIGALYSQYITAYAVLNAQAMGQLQAVQNLIGTPTGSSATFGIKYFTFVSV